MMDAPTPLYDNHYRQARNVNYNNNHPVILSKVGSEELELELP